MKLTFVTFKTAFADSSLWDSVEPILWKIFSHRRLLISHLQLLLSGELLRSFSVAAVAAGRLLPAGKL